ncbi:MAG TPA: Gfo/Idh/MocA family oxidoreductase [Acidobacteriota bacterium]|nr:Gfo/Idh/MocA family oxidoreductase [Acidobacteriota bacterium]
MRRNAVTRRAFLKTSTFVGFAGINASPLWGQNQASASDGLGVLAIGVRGRGGGVARAAGRFGPIVACCDVDTACVDLFFEKLMQQQAERPKVYKDYREALEHPGVDIVTIGTPDHWHTPILIAALNAGKDVYCEKPLTLTIGEGNQIAAAVKRTGRIVQVGTQQRTEFDQMFLKAVVLARSGRLGEKLTATCYIGEAESGGPFRTLSPPATLDWDLWLGPAPAVPYTEERCHNTFRWWFEYSGGKLTDWGAHHIDIAQWALRAENTGPVEIAAKGDLPIGRELTYELLTGQIEPEGPLNRYNTATRFKVAAKFANSNKIIVRHGPGNGVHIKGNLGELFVSRSMLTGTTVGEVESSQSGSRWLKNEVIELYRDREPTQHMDDFIHCVKERQQPISDVFTHHRVVSTCHLSNIALILGRNLRWDPESEDFINDPEASALISRDSRTNFS